jgi:hypothetical protein
MPSPNLFSINTAVPVCVFSIIPVWEDITKHLSSSVFYKRMFCCQAVDRKPSGDVLIEKVDCVRCVWKRMDSHFKDCIRTTKVKKLKMNISWQGKANWLIKR